MSIDLINSFTNRETLHINKPVKTEICKVDSEKCKGMAYSTSDKLWRVLDELL